MGQGSLDLVTRDGQPWDVEHLFVVLLPGMDHFADAFFRREISRKNALIETSRSRHGDFDDLVDATGLCFEDENTVRQIDRLVKIVRDKQDRDIDVFPDLEEVILHLGPGLGVKGTERLVHQ